MSSGWLGSSKYDFSGWVGLAKTPLGRAKFQVGFWPYPSLSLGLEYFLCFGHIRLQSDVLFLKFPDGKRNELIRGFHKNVKFVFNKPFIALEKNIWWTDHKVDF